MLTLTALMPANITSPQTATTASGGRRVLINTVTTFFRNVHALPLNITHEIQRRLRGVPPFITPSSAISAFHDYLRWFVS